MRRGLFSFREDPFRNHPDPRFFYPSPDYRKAYDRLVARVQEASGLALLLGSSGVGKTTLLAKLRQDLEAAGFCVICPKPGPSNSGSILERCCDAVGLPSGAGSTADSRRAFSDFLQAQRANDRAIALFIDDAQQLQPMPLVELWSLVQAGAGSKSVTSVVLAGRFELETRLRSPELSKINHAVCARVTLKPLEPKHIGAFIRHRLWIVGYTGPELFTDEAILRIADYSKGVPSLINLICGLSLKFARVVSEAVVSAEAVDDMQRFLGNIGPSTSTARPQPYDPQSIARLQKLYDLISLPHLRDSDSPPPAADEEKPPQVPREDEIFAEQDLITAISNALDWQPMPIEDVKETVRETVKETVKKDTPPKTEPVLRRKSVLPPLIPLAAGIVLVAFVAGGIAWLYQPDLNLRLLSIADLKRDSQTWKPDDDFADLEKVLGTDPTTKPAPQIPSQPTYTTVPQVEAPQTATKGLLGVAPGGDSEGPLLSDAIELAPAAVADPPVLEVAEATGMEGDPPVLEVAEATGMEGGEVGLSVVARLAEDAGEEALSVSVSGLPEGARLSAGERQADGSWRLAPADLERRDRARRHGDDGGTRRRQRLDQRDPARQPGGCSGCGSRARPGGARGGTFDRNAPYQGQDASDAWRYRLGATVLRSGRRIRIPGGGEAHGRNLRSLRAQGGRDRRAERGPDRGNRMVSESDSGR
jgi:type II secretory pathway predicted ATPase ExeA